MTVATRFGEMQEAEFAWWRDYLGHPTARIRMYALYGARYIDFFPDLFFKPVGAVVEYGAGPLPVLALTKAEKALAVDTLAPRYDDEGMLLGGVPWTENAGHVSSSEWDTALLLNVLDHTDEPEALVEQAHRALKPGGKAYLFVHLDQEDPKHKLVRRDEPERWFKGWLELRSNIQLLSCDPPAFVGVYQKQ